jgi:hypothetical protein
MTFWDAKKPPDTQNQPEKMTPHLKKLMLNKPPMPTADLF